MLLAIDTSTGTSVAVVDRDGASGELRCLVETGTDDTMRHAEVIGGFIRDALAGAGVDPSPTLRRRGGHGPGPFTGLRVGIAAAHAFALGIGRPFVPVVSHDAIALSRYRAGDTGPLQVVTDARRREFAVSRVRRTRRRRAARARASAPNSPPDDAVPASHGASASTRRSSRPARSACSPNSRSRPAGFRSPTTHRSTCARPT